MHVGIGITAENALCSLTRSSGILYINHLTSTMQAGYEQKVLCRFYWIFFSDFLIPIWLCIQTNFICLLNRNLAISEVRYFQSPVCQPNFTSLVQEIFLVIQNSDGHQHFSLCGWNLRMDFWFLPNIVFYMVVCDGSMSLHFSLSLTHTHNYVLSKDSSEKLDLVSIPRGRMYKHIELSCCKYEAFKVLAKNYLDICTRFLKRQPLVGRGEYDCCRCCWKVWCQRLDGDIVKPGSSSRWC